ncbi:MAG: hypothetical protein ABI113_02735 [Mucilaginibacter sp.]
MSVGSFSKDSICTGNGLANGVKELYRPVPGDKVQVFKGKVYQFGLDPAKNFIAISDSSSSALVRWRKSLLGNKDTYDALSKKYEQILSNASTASLCAAPNGDSNDNQTTQNFEKLKKSFKTIVVFDKSAKDTAWMGYKVFKDIAVLRKKALIADKGPYLVILGVNNGSTPPPIVLSAPAGPIKPTHPVITTPTPTTAHKLPPLAPIITIDNIEQYFHKLADRGVPDAEKSVIKTSILALFTSADDKVIQVNKAIETSTGMTIGKYVESVDITHRVVKVVDKKIQNGKIYELLISEK